jgi:hypothetical protein
MRNACLNSAAAGWERAAKRVAARMSRARLEPSPGRGGDPGPRPGPTGSWRGFVRSAIVRRILTAFLEAGTCRGGPAGKY